LDKVVFPQVFPFKIIALDSPALTTEILEKTRDLLLQTHVTAAQTSAETKIEQASPSSVPHTVTFKGKYMSVTLLPVLHRASEVADMYAMLQALKAADKQQRIKLVL